MARNLSTFPHWLELSGLPQQCGSTGWLVLRTIIDLDCSANSIPGTIDVATSEIAIRAGLEAEATRKALKQLQKKKLIRAFIADDNDENSLIQVANPIPGVRSH